MAGCVVPSVPFETLGSTYPAMYCLLPEDQKPQFHYCENLRLCMLLTVIYVRTWLINYLLFVN